MHDPAQPDGAPGSPPHAEPDATPSAVDWEAFYAELRAPDFLPGFQITHKLGAGVFGTVYKARKHSIGKDYAVKFLKVEDAETRAAVTRELEQMRHLAQLEHPNLVSIEDRGEIHGVPFLVMAFAGDRTLADRIAEGPLPPDEAWPILLQVARGVGALHEHGVVHFDLKPANVFLKGDIVRVGDYGLSKIVDGSRRSLSMGRGTPYYIAPEVLRRKGDARSDIYALGVLLYEMLVGEPPFRGDSEWEVLKKHEAEAVRFPDTVPTAARRVIARCMAKDPDARYRTVEELIAAVGEEAGVEDLGVGGTTGAETRVVPPSGDRRDAVSPAGGGAAPGPAPARPPRPERSAPAGTRRERPQRAAPRRRRRPGVGILLWSAAVGVALFFLGLLLVVRVSGPSRSSTSTAVRASAPWLETWQIVPRSDGREFELHYGSREGGPRVRFTATEAPTVVEVRRALSEDGALAELLRDIDRLARQRRAQGVLETSARQRLDELVAELRRHLKPVRELDDDRLWKLWERLEQARVFEPGQSVPETVLYGNR